MPETQPNPHKRPLPAVDVKPLGQPEPKSFGGITIGGVFMAPRRELEDPSLQADLLEKIDRMRKHLS